MTRIKATEVFTPGAFPSHTYVERTAKRYENRLRDALETPGQVVSLSGPSKSGKTVLVERVVGRETLIPITGAGIQHPDDVWDRVLDWMDVPSESSRTNTFETGVAVGGEAKGEIKVPLVAKGEVGVKGEVQASGSTAGTKVRRRRGMVQVIAEIGGSDFTLLIDDFHYMPRGIQEEVAKQLKDAVRQNVKIIIASVSHRSDDVVRANPELRGRVTTVDLEYWESKELRAIATRGFGVLSTEVPQEFCNRLVSESAGSPQLMQAICLNTCFELNIREKQADAAAISPSETQLRDVLERTAASTDFRSLVDVLDSGPKTRGTERKVYEFSDKTRGDVYRCVLKAVAANPPRLSLTYDELTRRVRSICVSEEPVGSSITGSCLHMSRLALEKFPKERVIDWDEQKQVFDIPDPYLLFYLRWSGRLLECED